MIYTIITVVLVVLSSILFLPKFKYLIEKQATAVNFMLSMVATLAGVLLAISISNYEAEVKEREDLVKLIDASIASINTAQGYSEALLEHSLTLNGEAEQSNFFNRNPLPYPQYLDVFITQSVVSKNLSRNAFIDLNGAVINLKRTLVSKPEVYVQLLERTRLLLNIERQYLLGEIGAADHENKLDEIEDRPFKN